MMQPADKIDHRRLVLCVHDLLLEHCPHCVATTESQIRCEAKPTTEDLAAEHDEVLAEVSEALRMYHSYLQSPEAAMLERAKAKEAEAKARLDAAREEHSRAHKAHFVAWDVVDSTWKESRKALANLSPEAREQLEARRVVVLDGTTYIVDASGDELQLLVSDPWVIS